MEVREIEHLGRFLLLLILMLCSVYIAHHSLRIPEFLLSLSSSSSLTKFANNKWKSNGRCSAVGYWKIVKISTKFPHVKISNLKIFTRHAFLIPEVFMCIKLQTFSSNLKNAIVLLRMNCFLKIILESTCLYLSLIIDILTRSQNEFNFVVKKTYTIAIEILII